MSEYKDKNLDVNGTDENTSQKNNEGGHMENDTEKKISDITYDTIVGYSGGHTDNVTESAANDDVTHAGVTESVVNEDGMYAMENEQQASGQKEDRTYAYTNQGTGYEEGRYYTYQNSEPEADNKKKSKKGGFLRKFTATIGFAATFGVIAGVCIHFTSDYFGDNTEKTNVSIGGNNTTVTGSQALTTTPVLKEDVTSSSDISTVVENVMPCVVSITEKSRQTVGNYWYGYQSEQEVEGSGSGIIIKEDDELLYIATNNHVISGADSIEVTFTDEKTASATVKGAVSSEDVAVITVEKSALEEDTLKAIKVATLGDSESVKVGEGAIAIGNALGYGQSVTAGVISATDREISVSSSDNTITIKVIQTDAAINPGNSGGALLNSKGEVIGINSAKLASSEVEGMGYAIPISQVLPILNNIISKEELSENEKGYLGIIGSTVTSGQQEAYGLPEGIYVTSVSDDGPAKEAGLLQGDIITGIDEVKVTQMEDLSSLIKSYKVGTTITIKYKRLNNGEYKESSLEVKLASLPDELKTESSSDDSDSKGGSDDSNNNNNNKGNDNSNSNNNGNSNDGDYYEAFW